MTNAELIAKIKAEIERLKDENRKIKCQANERYCSGYDDAFYDLVPFLDILESEKPINPEEAMKELDEKIALVKQRGTWDGVDVDKYMDEVRGREPGKPVPNDLEEAAEKHLDTMFGRGKHQPFYKDLFIAGAKWKEEQFEKNRLTACGNQTKEEYDRETDFALGIIKKEHRQPAFSDAINYGMRLQKEQMMKEAVEGEYDFYPAAVYLDVPIPRMNHGNKVRIIVCKNED